MLLNAYVETPPHSATCRSFRHCSAWRIAGRSAGANGSRSGYKRRRANFQLSAESREFYQALHAGEQHVLSFYGYYLAALAKGDLGYSLLFQRPVRELLKERLPVTITGIILGVLVGWALG